MTLLLLLIVTFFWCYFWFVFVFADMRTLALAVAVAVAVATHAWWGAAVRRERPCSLEGKRAVSCVSYSGLYIDWLCFVH